MIEISLIIALAVNGLIVNPAYQWILYKLNLNRKPFNCILCLSFWLGVIAGGVSIIATGNCLNLTIPLVASFLAVLAKRLFEALPSAIN